MPGNFQLPGVGKPTQPTNGPLPPATPIKTEDTHLALEPQFKDIYKTWKNSNTFQANDMMLKALSPVIDNAVKTFSGGSDNSVIRSKAKKIIIDALPKYDPNNTKLKTFVFNQLQGLKRFSTQSGQIISIPEKVHMDFVNLKKTEEQLKDDLGRDPSDEELADASSLSLKRINYVRNLRMPSSEGTMLRPMANSEGGEFNDPSVVGGASAKELSGWHYFVYNSLGGPDKLIMEHSFGMNGKPVLSNQQLAKKLNVTSAAISLRKNKIQTELDKRDSLKVI